MEPPPKKPRQYADKVLRWGPPAVPFRLLLQGDSKLVINWLNGTWTPSDNYVTEYVSMLHVMLGSLHDRGVKPMCDDEDVAHHLPREGNVAADLLCKMPTGMCTLHLPLFAAVHTFNNFIVRFDGSKNKRTGFCSCAFIIYGSHQVAANTAELTTILVGSWQLPATCKVIDAELAGCCMGLRAILALATSKLRGFIWETHIPRVVHRPLERDH